MWNGLLCTVMLWNVHDSWLFIVLLISSSTYVSRRARNAWHPFLASTWRAAASRLVLIINEKIFPFNPTSIAHWAEDTISLLPEFQRFVHLCDTTLVHHTDAIVLDDRAQPMRDAQKCFLPAIVRWIFWSVSNSTDEVASSQTMIREPRTRARARAMSCRAWNLSHFLAVHSWWPPGSYCHPQDVPSVLTPRWLSRQPLHGQITSLL